MIARSAALALGALTLLAAPSIAGEGWYDDFDAAAAVAKEQGKGLLVDFTGSDWCIWCKRLHEEVFVEEAFLTAANKDYVLVALDFPNSDEAKAKVPNPERNDELREKYEIRGFPTVLLMSAAGEVFAQTGYQPGGAEKYVEHMTEIATAGRKALAVTAEIEAGFAAATGEAKQAMWEKAVGVLELLDGGSPFAPRLAPTARWAFEVDPKNESGMKLRAVKALLKSGQIDDETVAIGRELDPENENGVLEQVVQAQFMTVTDDVTAKAALEALDALSPLGFVNKEIGFDLTFTAARWSAGPLQDPARAKAYAEAAKAIGSDNEEILKALDEIIGG